MSPDALGQLKRGVFEAFIGSLPQVDARFHRDKTSASDHLRNPHRSSHSLWLVLPLLGQDVSQGGPNNRSHESTLGEPLSSQAPGA